MLFTRIMRSLVFLIFIGITSIYASNSPVKFNMDYARFQYDSTSTYVEVYYTAFVKTADSLEKNPEIIPGSQALDFELLKVGTDSILANDHINLDLQGGGSLPAHLQQGTVGMLKLILPEGKYLFRMYNQRDTLAHEVSVLPFKSEHITISDIELCTNIITHMVESDNPYYKNTMQVIPNPSLLYGKGMPVLFYYLELYNLMSTEGNPGDKVSLQVVVADPDGNIRLKREYERTRNVNSTVEKGTFNVSKLESGLYTLIVAVTDPINNESVYRRRNFYVHNPDIIVAREEPALSYAESQFTYMTEAELDQKFAEAQYLANKSEIQIYNLLNSADSKREFLLRFWKTRTRENPDLIEDYYSRVDYTNENFRSGGTKGWQTDMGRVYILYGQPDQIEKFPSGQNENPYEIWQYHNVEGGVEFDFVDTEGFGQYRLVNSTKRGEINDPNWRNYVFR
jgi:GWxTD domain-containing protein